MQSIRTTLVAIFLGVAGVIVIFFAFVAAATPSRSEDIDGRWVRQTIRQQYRVCDWDGSCYYRHRYVTVRRYQPPVYAYVRRDRNDEPWERRDAGSERGVHCKDSSVRVVGGAHLTKDGAMNDAIRQWQSTIRYDSGEKFMDIENARGYRWRCDRASTNETLAGRVGEAVGAGSGFQKRCVVVATPCMMPVTRGEKDER